MRVTNIRNKFGNKLTELQMQHLLTKLAGKIRQAGFITEVERINASSIRIGLHMKSFTVDVARLGYNARVHGWSAKRSTKGYVRTNIPTWEQREVFNHIVNDVFDSLKYSARITSGEYLIRDKSSGRVNEWEKPEGSWNNYFGQYQEHPLLTIVPEVEAAARTVAAKDGLTLVSSPVAYKAAA